jgi:hypothetical protein
MRDVTTMPKENPASRKLIELVRRGFHTVGTSDGHAPRRAHGHQHKVPTISLMDLLQQAQTPRRVEYLSVDTEGSELNILAAFDFRQYEFQVIPIEHNYTPNRGHLHELLMRQGYLRNFEALSQWDDWYVRGGRGPK